MTINGKEYSGNVYNEYGVIYLHLDDIGCLEEGMNVEVVDGGVRYMYRTIQRIDGNHVRLRVDKEHTMDEADEDPVLGRIRELKQYLADTDYVISKIAEASVLGEGTSILLAQYSDVIARRKECRDEINLLENKE